MKRYGSTADPQGLLFDIDGTLYDHPAYMASHAQVLTEQLAMELGRSYDEVRQEVRAVRDRIAVQAGRTPSLANTFLEFGIDMERNVAWRSRLLKPERYLERDPRLADTLERLAGRYRLAALTNNPADIAHRTLECLGVGGLLPRIVALDDTYVSKPDPAPFLAGLRVLELAPAEVVMIGDRYDVDIAPALEIGMSGILAEGVADVYALPETLFRAG